MNPFEEIKEKQEENLLLRQQEFKKVVESEHYKLEMRHLHDFSFDAINTIRGISFYSTRAKALYDEFLTIRASDDLIQSIFGISFLVENGIHNIAKREIRYLLEMTVKYLIVDQEMSGKTLTEKTEYLRDNVPRSSLDQDVLIRMSLPFDEPTNKAFRDEISSVYSTACTFVHPSKTQIDEQLKNYERGIYIGFETAKMLSSMKTTLFRSYDLILTMLFTGFGNSLSGDLFINDFDFNPKWKFHKGKFVEQYSRLFDYKLERKED